MHRLHWECSVPVRCCPSGPRWVCWSRGPQPESRRSPDQSSLCSETFLRRARTNCWLDSSSYDPDASLRDVSRFINLVSGTQLRERLFIVRLNFMNETDRTIPHAGSACTEHAEKTQLSEHTRARHCLIRIELKCRLKQKSLWQSRAQWVGNPCEDEMWSVPHIHS